MCNSPTYQADIPHDETNPFSNKHSLPKIVRFLASIIFVPFFAYPAGVVKHIIQASELIAYMFRNSE